MIQQINSFTFFWHHLSLFVWIFIHKSIFEFCHPPSSDVRECEIMFWLGIVSLTIHHAKSSSDSILAISSGFVQTHDTAECHAEECHRKTRWIKAKEGAKLWEGWKPAFENRGRYSISPNRITGFISRGKRVQMDTCTRFS